MNYVQMPLISRRISDFACIPVLVWPLLFMVLPSFPFIIYLAHLTMTLNHEIKLQMHLIMKGDACASVPVWACGQCRYLGA